MTQSEKTCDRCGGTIPPESPAGLCPHCMLDLDPEPDAGEPAPLAEPLPSEPPPPGTKLRYIGDYELLEEIARGGMGVVYKARQMGLNRPVAVKMILSGQFAREAEVKRFHTEAEAAANLNHPNIVSIYEVSEYQGHHYYSMQLVEGQNLDHLVKTGQWKIDDLRATAQLLYKLARAVHYAHQRGIMHRDIKPANILIDKEGEPHITDFGLAKRFEPHVTDIALDEPTRSGVIMGTPSFMSPEQAHGHCGQITTATDVYSLGAVLYYLLTGRPPFIENNYGNIYAKLMLEEPVNPKTLNPKIDCNLETICLKCLQKDPGMRPASAHELMQQLQKWLNREPIDWRPAPWWRSLWAWVRRNRQLAAAQAAVFILLFAVIALLAKTAIDKNKAIDDLRKQVQQDLTDLWQGPEVRYHIRSEQRRALAGRPPLKSPLPVQDRPVFAVYTHREPRKMLDGFSPILEVLERKLSIPIEFVIYKGYSNAITPLVEGKVHFMKMGPVPYMIARNRETNLVLLAKQLHDGKPSMRGVIFTRADRPFSNLREMKAQRNLSTLFFAFADQSSTFGSCLAEAELVEAGLYQTSFAGHQHFPSHTDVVAAVSNKLSNFVAGAANINDVNEAIAQGVPLKILAPMESVTFAWVAATNLPPKIAQTIQRTLLELKNPKVLKGIDKPLTGFQEATPADYLPLKSIMLKAAQFEGGVDDVVWD